jgi:SCP-2 sterol transfer family
MADEIETFFDELGPRGPRLLPKKISGTIRFDLAEDGQVEHWYVTIDGGNVSVSRAADPADTVVHADRDLFGQIVAGYIGINSAGTSSQILVEGDYLPLIAFTRFFYSPPGTVDPRELAARRRA